MHGNKGLNQTDDLEVAGKFFLPSKLFLINFMSVLADNKSALFVSLPI